eukprot:4461564-Amphidinium_carterae.1
MTRTRMQTRERLLTRRSCGFKQLSTATAVYSARFLGGFLSQLERVIVDLIRCLDYPARG